MLIIYFFYNDYDELLSKISFSSKEDKWLIFTSSKVEGRILQEKISFQTKRSVGFLSADKKGSSTWKKITDDSDYAENVLIATKTLDNGINIHNRDIKNIVLPFCHRIEFLQMLGRKRVDEIEVVNVYAKQPTHQLINTRLKALNKQYYTMLKIQKIKQKLDEAYCNNNQKQREYWQDKMIEREQRIWNDNDSQTRKLFYIDGNGCLVPNILAFCKINLLFCFYHELLSANGIPSYIYSQMLRQWMNYSEEEIHRYITAPDCEDIYVFLKKYEEVSIPKEEQEDFYKAFMDLYKPACCIKYADEPQKLKEALSVRKEKARRKATINECLKFLEWHKVIKSRKRKWEFKLPEDTPEKTKV